MGRVALTEHRTAAVRHPFYIFREATLSQVTIQFSGDSMAEHPTTEVIAAYLSNGLPASDRVTLETHLSTCRDCRQEVVSARRLLETRPVRHRWQVLVPLAAAAVLAIVLVGRGFLSPKPELVRAGSSEAEAGAVHSLHALIPAKQATVDRNALVFAWTPSPGRPLYRLTLTDASGHAVWTRNTEDTTVGLPAEIKLAPSRKYFWYVDALDSNGQSLTTGTRQFSTAP